MQQDENETTEKQPIDMTTDEAVDFVFAPELAEGLRKLVRENDGDCEPEGQ